MKTSIATSLSVFGILATGGVAMAVNTTVLDSTVSSAQQTQVLAEANVPVSSLSTGSTIPSDSGTTAFTGLTAVQTSYVIDGVGTVTLEQNGSDLSVISVLLLPGWTYDSENESTSRVEIDFENANKSVEFHAELINGRVVTAVEVDDEADEVDDDADEVDDADEIDDDEADDDGDEADDDEDDDNNDDD